MTIPGIQALLGDTFARMAEIPDGSIDMVLADLPYGMTACKWDSVIPFEPLWAAYKRICKPNAAIVLTASQPFTSALVMSNPKMFKYDWTWQKTKGTGHLHAKRMPMRDKEDILVFCTGQCAYNPQFSIGVPFRGTARTQRGPSIYRECGTHRNDNLGTRYPKQVLNFNFVGEGKAAHATRKPVALMEYLILTYTNPGDLVLDNTMGSGTTGVAAILTGRRFVGIERDEKYFEIACERMRKQAATSPVAHVSAPLVRSPSECLLTPPQAAFTFT